MKAVGAALVVIAGAAVLLWFANTSNSWVLAGLIGGVSGVFLSVPISLTLYSYLNHPQQTSSLLSSMSSIGDPLVPSANATGVYAPVSYDPAVTWSGQVGYTTVAPDPYQWSQNGSTYPPSQYPPQTEQPMYGNETSVVFPY